MSERITETRYGIAQLMSLVEVNSAMIFLVLGLILTQFDELLGAVFCMAFAAIAIFPALNIQGRGWAYRLAERMGREPDWTFNDVDTDKLRENGYVIIND